METPYTKAYTDNLIVGMERTRDEVKAAISALMDMKGTNGAAIALAGRLHRTVGAITQDLRGNTPLPDDAIAYYVRWRDGSVFENAAGEELFPLERARQIASAIGGKVYESETDQEVTR